MNQNKNQKTDGEFSRREFLGQMKKWSAVVALTVVGASGSLMGSDCGGGYSEHSDYSDSAGYNLYCNACCHDYLNSSHYNYYCNYYDYMDTCCS